MVHYQNPKVVVGCIPEWEDRILLCRRAIEPRSGYWTIPAGFLENGESVADAAARETLEEAGARVEIQGLYGVFNLPRIAQVYMFFRARMLDGDPQPGPETTEQRLFTEDEIPWEDLAFAVVREALKLFFHDRSRGEYPVRMGDLVPDRSDPLGFRGAIWTPPGSGVY
jgi:ADP-ribose pyrophosphatase YjhB (NUDIX family)